MIALAFGFASLGLSPATSELHTLQSESRRTPAVHYATYDSDLTAPTFAATFPFNVTMLRPVGTLVQPPSGEGWPCGYGCGPKLDAYRNFVATVPAHDVVFLFDARDVMFAGCPSPAAAYAQIGHRIVFGAELGCFPSDALCATNRNLFEDIHPLNEEALAQHVHCDHTCSEPPGYRFLNSGFIAGRARELLQLLNPSESDSGWPASIDDQRAMAEAYARHRGVLDVGLDYSAALVLNLQRMLPTSVVRRDGQLYSELMQQAPCFVHGNGDGKEWMGTLVNASD